MRNANNVFIDGRFMETIKLSEVLLTIHQYGTVS